jgi:uncharacterized protein YwqG
MADQLTGEQSAKLDSLITRHRLSDHSKKIRKAARPCIDIAVGKAVKRPPVGTSRLGGIPDLPPGLDYPEEDDQYFLFVCQISLKEIGIPSSLPPEGMLYFFVLDAEMAGDVDHEVLFHGGGADGLQRAVLPKDAEVALEECRLDTPYGLKFAPGISPPDYYDEWTQENLEEESEALDRYLDLLGDLAESRPGGQMLGYPRLANLEELPTGTSLLLELNSHEEMQWWDAGALQFLIEKRALASKRFANTHARIYTS